MNLPLSFRPASLALAGFLTLAAAAQAAPGWNESLDGDLSNDRLAPSAVLFAPGSNFVSGTTQAGDRDYFTFSLAPGQSWTSLFVTAYTSADSVAFMAFQAGSTFTEPPSGTTVGNLLGYAHFGPGNVGSDILPVMNAAPGAIGFTAPLTGASYSFWVQQTGPSVTAYTLDFQIVPEPGAWGLLGCGALALGAAVAARFSRKSATSV